MQLCNDVLGALSKADISGNQVVLTGQLDRSLYVKVNKALEAAGGKWNRKAKAHIFDSDAEERIDQMILTGEIEVPKDDFGYFPTPEPVAERLITQAQIKNGMKILEPSAGQGAIALAVLKYFDHVDIDLYEILEQNCNVLKDTFCNVTQTDFLLVEPSQIYDRVVMNPPFAKQADIKHVTHAYKFLKPDGVLVSIMSSSVTFRENKLTTEFRNFINQCNGSIEELPQGSFKESGTMVNTVIATLPRGL